MGPSGLCPASPPMRDHSHPAVAFHAVALVAAARSALQMARQIGDRRAGRDASAQEPEGTVRTDLDALRADLGALVVRLRLRVVVRSPESEAAALAQAFEDRTLLDDLGRTLSVIHQKLLSLYPGVDEEVVETTRRLASEARQRAVSDTYARALADFVARASDLRDALAEAA